MYILEMVYNTSRRYIFSARKTDGGMRESY